MYFRRPILITNTALFSLIALFFVLTPHAKPTSAVSETRANLYVSINGTDHLASKNTYATENSKNVSTTIYNVSRLQMVWQSPGGCSITRAEGNSSNFTYNGAPGVLNAATNNSSMPEITISTKTKFRLLCDIWPTPTEKLTLIDTLVLDPSSSPDNGNDTSVETPSYTYAVDLRTTDPSSGAEKGVGQNAPASITASDSTYTLHWVGDGGTCELSRGGQSLQSGLAGSAVRGITSGGSYEIVCNLNGQTFSDTLSLTVNTATPPSRPTDSPVLDLWLEMPDGSTQGQDNTPLSGTNATIFHNLPKTEEMTFKVGVKNLTQTRITSCSVYDQQSQKKIKDISKPTSQTPSIFSLAIGETDTKYLEVDCKGDNTSGILVDNLWIRVVYPEARVTLLGKSYPVDGNRAAESAYADNELKIHSSDQVGIKVLMQGNIENCSFSDTLHPEYNKTLEVKEEHTQTVGATGSYSESSTMKVSCSIRSSDRRVEDLLGVKLIIEIAFSLVDGNSKMVIPKVVIKREQDGIVQDACVTRSDGRCTWDNTMPGKFTFFINDRLYKSKLYQVEFGPADGSLINVEMIANRISTVSSRLWGKVGSAGNTSPNVGLFAGSTIKNNVSLSQPLLRTHLSKQPAGDFYYLDIENVGKGNYVAAIYSWEVSGLCGKNSLGQALSCAIIKSKSDVVTLKRPKGEIIRRDLSVPPVSESVTFNFSAKEPLVDLLGISLNLVSRDVSLVLFDSAGNQMPKSPNIGQDYIVSRSLSYFYIRATYLRHDKFDVICRKVAVPAFSAKKEERLIFEFASEKDCSYCCLESEIGKKIGCCQNKET
ncbi:MAG TPA: hypothetical protein PK263_01085 [bacterium]|nr:hypothetical protein [bacterium]